MSRYGLIAAFTLMLLGMPSLLRAQGERPVEDIPIGEEIALEAEESAGSYPETWPSEMESVPQEEWTAELHEAPISEPGQQPYHFVPPTYEEEDDEWSTYLPKPKWFGLRHSSTHGRHVGRGQPFQGTSWRNRPFYIGGEIGPKWFTEPLGDNLNEDVDFFGGIFAGWDFDHYWGNEFHWDWATPEFKNSSARDADRTDSLYNWNYSLMYYPWGDAKVRPFWRAGIGMSHFDYPTDFGWRYDEWMWTFPIGLGVKYPFRRWLAGRMELTDFITLDDGHPTQHSVAITFALEWRFGAHPPSYYPWHPHRSVW